MNKQTELEKPVSFNLYKLCMETPGPQRNLWSLCQYSFTHDEIAYLLAGEDVNINHVDQIYQTTPLMQVMQPKCKHERAGLIRTFNFT